jgi:3-polyprenyl-4-hydroxybenzoate decarboxylase
MPPGARDVRAPPRRSPTSFDSRISGWKVLAGGFVVVKVKSDARAVLSGLMQWAGLGRVRFVTAVSEDVDLSDEENTIWGIFSRFDPARDMLFSEQKFVGAKPVYSDRIGIDATWKEGYPLPLMMSEKVVRLVDCRCTFCRTPPSAANIRRSGVPVLSGTSGVAKSRRHAR